MSSATQPISPGRFAAALPDLPLSSLHAKAAELQNSIAHLLRSNAQLAPFAADGDADCAEAIHENSVVVERQRERIELLRREVTGRGFRWADPAEAGTEDGHVGLAVVPVEDPDADGQGQAATGQRNGESSGARTQTGRLSDEELSRRLAAQMQEDDQDGMHL